MTVQTHISLAAVDEKIDYYESEYEFEPYENGPIAKEALFDFLIEGIAEGKFDDPAAVCVHVRRRLREFMER